MRIRSLLAVFAFASLFLAGTFARADEGDPPGRVGRVAQLVGSVRTVDADGAWVDLSRNRPLTTGDRVVTGHDGRATLQIGSSTVRLGPDSDMSVAQLDDEKIRLRFGHGVLALRVRSNEVLGEISVETDEGPWVPHHSGYFRFDRAPGQVLAAMAWSGDMLLEAHDSSLPVAANQRAEVWQEGAQQTTHYRLVAIPSDAFADWALQQDKLDDRALAGTTGAGAPPAASVPPEMTGAGDLSQYGRWASSTDYGTVWYPNGVPAGWAPYQDGAWSWISPWGWTWIDNAPWGFAPFHYGRWAWINGHWAWCPGVWGPRPIYAPGLVGWVGGPGFAIGGNPAIGWVPLAPNEPFYPAYPISPVYWNLVNGAHNVPPVRRGPGPVTVRPRAMPVGPVTYANRSVAGAVSVVPAQALAVRQPLPAQRPAGAARLASEVAAGKAQASPPPAAPSGRSLLGAGAMPAVAAPARSGMPTPANAPAPAQQAAPATPGKATPGRPAARPVSALQPAPAASDVEPRRSPALALQPPMPAEPALAGEEAPLAPPPPAGARMGGAPTMPGAALGFAGTRSTGGGVMPAMSPRGGHQ